MSEYADAIIVVASLAVAVLSLLVSYFGLSLNNSRVKTSAKLYAYSDSPWWVELRVSNGWRAPVTLDVLGIRIHAKQRGPEAPEAIYQTLLEWRGRDLPIRVERHDSVKLYLPGSKIMEVCGERWGGGHTLEGRAFVEMELGAKNRSVAIDDFVPKGWLGRYFMNPELRFPLVRRELPINQPNL